MYGSWARVHTTSTIIQIINTNNINCNHMRQRKSVQSPNIYIPFGVNKSNWLKKVSTPAAATTSNCNDQQRHRTANSIDWNQTLSTTKATKRRRRHASSRKTSIIINWNNIRCRRLNSRSRHLLPTQTTTATAAATTTTHFGRENILTNLNVHFECDNCYFFNTSPKIYSR